MTQRRLRIQDYTVGWVCALPIELAAATTMLDEEHQSLPQDSNDTNLYTLGHIGEHNVVLACLPAGQTGLNSAATVAIWMKAKFVSMRFGLMVGVGGGVPSAESDIRLGDVVVSQPHMHHGGVVQYDFGKTGPSGFTQTGSLNMPPTVLLTALAKIRANHYIGRSNISTYMSAISDIPHFTLARAGRDILFESTYEHVGGPTCDRCSRDKLVERTAREGQEVVIHYGTIASGNQIMRDGVTRDRLSSELGGVLCFDMEAAGLMNDFPCVVIRGICDYADSHKNKKWQPYAAATAAACAKELLSVIPSADVAKTRTVDEVIEGREANDPDQIDPPRRMTSIPAVAVSPGIRRTNTNTVSNINRQLAPADFQPDLARIEDTRCPGTGSWLRKDKAVMDWLKCDSTACLLLTGGPGSGKTYLMGSMIRYLHTLHLKEASVAVTYFLFDGKSDDSSRRLSLAVLQTIAAQLFEQVAKLNPRFVETRLEAIADSQRRLHFVPRNQLCTIVREATQHLSMTYIILDALDECEDVPELLRLFRPLLTEGGSLKLLFSSQNTRHIPELVAQLPARIQHRLVLDGQTMKEDITQLINFRTETMDIEDVGPPQETCRVLVAGSQGLILLAKLRLDTLEQQLLSTDVDMETALQRLPIGVRHYYELALARLSDEELSLARDMFIWVLYAQATLSIEELIEASSLRFDKPGVKSAKLSRRGIRRLGAGLVEVVDNQIKLSHATVREFAVNHDWGGEKLGKIPDPNKIHLRMAIFLLDYMSRSDLVADVLSARGLAPEEAGRWPLLGYAVKYWLAHLRLSGRGEPELVHRVGGFLGSDEGLAWWIQFAVGIDSYNWWLVPQISSDLFALFHQKSLSSPTSQTSSDIVATLCERHVRLLADASSERQLIAYIHALNRLAGKEVEVGRLEKAEQLLNRAIRSSESLPSELNESSIILTLISLCSVNLQQGKYSEVISHCDRIDSLLDPSKTEHNRYFIETRRIRGEVENGRYHSRLSESILREAHQRASTTLGDQDPYTLATRNALALTCMKLGKFAESEKLLDIAYYEAVLGKEHPSTLTGAENFTDARRSSGKLIEAERRCANIYSRRIKIQGPRAEATILTGSKLASIYREQGKVTIASDLLKSLLAQYSAPGDSENQLTLSLKYDSAWIKYEEGKLRESEELLEDGYQTRIHRLGLNHPWSVDTAESLAILKRASGKLKEAEMLQKDVLQVRKEIGEEGDPCLLRAMGILATIKGDQGELTEAEQLQEEAIKGWKEIGDEDQPYLLTAMGDLASIKRKLKKLTEAEQLEKQVLEIRKRIGDEDGPHMLTAMANLAITKAKLGNTEEAELLEEHVLEIRRKAGDNERPSVLTAMGNLAITKDSLGKLKEAEQLEEQVLEARRKALDEEDPKVLTAMTNLAITKRKLEKLEEAERMEERVLDIRKKDGDEDPDVLVAMANLAITKCKLEKLEEGEKLEEHVLEARRKALGEEDPEVFTATANLAITKRNLGKLEEAERLEERVLEGRRKLGSEEPSIATAIANLAITKARLEKFEEAEQLEEQVLKIRKSLAGEEEDNDVLIAMANLAITKGKLDKLTEAEQLEEQVLQARKIGNEESSRVLRAMSNLAITKRSLRKLEEAEQLEERVLEVQMKNLGEEEPDVLSSMVNLANTKRVLGKLEETEQLEERVVATYEKIGGKSRIGALTAMSNLAVTKGQRGKLKEAIDLQVFVLNEYKKRFGPDNPDTLKEMSTLAWVYKEAGNYSEAEKLGEEVLKAREKELSPEHPSVLNAMTNLANIYDAKCDGEKSFQMHRRVLEIRMKIQGPDHPATIDAMDSVAISDVDPESSYDPEQMMSHVVQWRTERLGAEHPETLGCKHRLAMILMSRRRFEEAEKLQLEVLDAGKHVFEKESFEILRTKEMLGLCYFLWGKSEKGVPLMEEVLSVRERLLGPDHPDTEFVRRSLDIAT
ncbi:hypothetical protein GP486_006033 [Trichoglossum hirsutum]|uniref:Nucleoside phosphorylase domain-containing protein n=1 Tax=Trichoglossum hirsutum TaxID=265104 RepID=A0A9P8RLL9_9PEZI|nr:hypothetical protein GP486_006033 [Trichoglossum hirsutum]